VILSLGLFFLLRAWERRDLEKRAGTCTRDQVERVQADMLRSMEILQSISSLYSAHGKIDRGEFHQFVQNALARQPEIQALSWNPIVTDKERADLESQTFANGADRFEIHELNSSGDLIRAGIRLSTCPFS